MKNALITILVYIFISTPFVVATPLPPSSIQSFASRDGILDPPTNSIPDIESSNSLNIDSDSNLVPPGLSKIKQIALFQTNIFRYVEMNQAQLILSEETERELAKLSTVSRSFKATIKLPSDLEAYVIPSEYFETKQTWEEVMRVLGDRESQSGWNKRNLRLPSVKGLEAISNFLEPMRENWSTILVHDPYVPQPPRAKRKAITDETGRRKLVRI
ncbi:hypothetical protein H0H93_006691 [Arthromyces matolae]|nr:hypothetical protein H0H93_006691 [Arthromyces matolae]